MASITREIRIATPSDEVWAALRDWGAVHTRLAPGFVVDAHVEGEDRVVTFIDGTTVKELFVALDEEQRRLVWAVHDNPLGLRHYNASAQVIAADDGGTRFVWTADLLPHDLRATVAGLMEQGLEAIRTALEGQMA
jgi:carbon monoxide dehydrogenase subunit G